MKKVVTEKKVERKEFTLEEAFVLWKNESKNKIVYLAGNTSEKLGKEKLVAYFNTNKKNPKEPDIRVYDLDKEGKMNKEVADLWETVSPKNVRYLTGTTDEKEKLVAFYGDENQEKRPYIRVYFQEK